MNRPDIWKLGQDFQVGFCSNQWKQQREVIQTDWDLDNWHKISC